MALEQVSDSDARIKQMEDYLLSLLPIDGTPIGNVTLMGTARNAGWSEQDYWQIRNGLMDRGIVARGRGRGGSTRRVVGNDALGGPISPTDGEVTAGTSPNGSFAPEYRIDEASLYEPMAKVIAGNWTKDSGFDSHVIEITARQGRRETGGKWSRPDITLASVTTYPYVPGKHLDVITFEVKPYDLMDVTAVYEVLAHKRAAHRSYLVLYVPENQLEALAEVVEEIGDEAKRHGIGLIVASEPNDYEAWEERVPAARQDPDPKRLNDFLARQLSQAFREQIAKWFK